MESKIRPLAALAQLEFRRLPLNYTIKKGVKYHVKYMHLPLCSKGHTVFSLVDCWEVKMVRDREGKEKT